MPWAKVDDRYDDNPRIKRAWKSHPAAVGLHTMAVTYSCRHELDGVIDHAWIEEKLPVKRERELVCGALLEAGLFGEHEDGYEIHNFLEFNPSRAELVARRTKDRVRKESRGIPRGSQPESKRNLVGNTSDSSGTHARPRAQDGMGAVGVIAKDNGEQPQLTRELVDEACAVLAAVDRWEVDEVGVENALATEPAGEVLRACHLAASWGSDPGWQMGPAATLRSAMRKLDAEKPKADENAERRSRRGAALQTLMARTEPAT